MTNAGIFNSVLYDHRINSSKTFVVVKAKASNYDATFVAKDGLRPFWFKGRESDRIAPPTLTSWKS